MAGISNLRAIQPAFTPSVSDLVYEELYRRVVELKLPPGTKISEADVAQQMNVSRQPVRDAFFRLSQVGFLIIRPQRATTIAPISVEAVLRAKFIRTAIELETARMACERIRASDLRTLTENLNRQRKAISRDKKEAFHRLDDEFHLEICRIAGAEFAWSVIREKKGQMDRVRFFSLDFGAQSAYDDHAAIFEALKSGDIDAARNEMRMHLSRISEIIDKLRAQDTTLLQEDAR